MSITERSDGIVRVAFNRPGKKNAMIGAMYTSLADIFNEANGDEEIRVVLWHGVGQSFCVGNDVEDFLKHPPRPGDCPQGRLIEALIRFEKPIVVVVQGAAIRAAIERRCGGAYITNRLRCTAKIVTRTTLRAVLVGGPLTLIFYMILAGTVATMLLVRVLSTCWVRDGFDSVFRVGSWFS